MSDVAGMASRQNGKGRGVGADQMGVLAFVLKTAILIVISPKQPRTDSPDVKLSKFLSYVCRHGAEKEGLQLHDGEWHMYTQGF